MAALPVEPKSERPRVRGEIKIVEVYVEKPERFQAAVETVLGYQPKPKESAE